MKAETTWGCFSDVLLLVFSHFFTQFKFSNLIFIFVDYGNITFQNYWLGIKINLVVIAAKCFFIWYLYIQPCNKFMIYFGFFNIKHWVVYLVSSYSFSEKHLVFNLPPQTYGKKRDSNVIRLLFSRHSSWFWALWFQVFITAKKLNI